MKRLNKQKGITLVALVITIIILLILAGITISQLTQSGLFENVRLAKEKYKNAEKLENEMLQEYEKNISGNREQNRRKRDLLYNNTEGTYEEDITLKNNWNTYSNLIFLLKGSDQIFSYFVPVESLESLGNEGVEVIGFAGPKDYEMDIKPKSEKEFNISFIRGFSAILSIYGE